jgi:hypothetical protein
VQLWIFYVSTPCQKRWLAERPAVSTDGLVNVTEIATFRDTNDFYMNHRFALVFAFVTVALVSQAQNNFDTVRIRPLKVADQIYLLAGAGGNIGVMTGKDGTLMIDDQFAPLSNRINGAIKTLDPGEIRFLVNTHLHGDHSGGNENFKKMGVTVVAQNNVRGRMSKETVNQTTKEVTPPRDQNAWPVITFPDRMQFHLNDEDIELMYEEQSGMKPNGFTTH